jgi:hypothetical protein
LLFTARLKAFAAIIAAVAAQSAGRKQAANPRAFSLI